VTSRPSSSRPSTPPANSNRKTSPSNERNPIKTLSVEPSTAQDTEPSGYRNTYGDRADHWDVLVVPILAELGAVVLSEQTGFDPASVYRVLNGSWPHPANGRRYEQAALDHARDRAANWDISVPHDLGAVLWLYLGERSRRGEDVRRCQRCGRPILPEKRADARYHSDACRKAAERERRAS
jgi:hypothetical protein